jgi:hypothetical protein
MYVVHHKLVTGSSIEYYPKSFFEDKMETGYNKYFNSYVPTHMVPTEQSLTCMGVHLTFSNVQSSLRHWPDTHEVISGFRSISQTACWVQSVMNALKKHVVIEDPFQGLQ